MHLIEEACYLTSKELVTRGIAENNRLTKIIQADDIIEISAEYLNGNNRLSLADDFIDRMKKSPASNSQNITDFFSPSKNKYIKPHSYYQLADKGDFRPVYLILQKVDDYTISAYSKNKLIIQIHKLSHFKGSRYRALIQAMKDSNLFEFKRRSPQSNKRTYNALRQVLKRRFTISNYEWGLVFNNDISKVIYEALPRIPHIKKSGGTYYLQNTPRSQCKIKIYNIDAASPERINQSLEFRQGDRLKIEITFKHRYFIDHPKLTVSNLTYQNSISDLLYLDNRRLLEQCLIRHLKPAEFRKIMALSGVTSRGDFMAIISDSRTTQIDTDKRLDKIEAHLHQLDEATKKNTSAIADIKNFIEYKENKQDKRKLRVVK